MPWRPRESCLDFVQVQRCSRQHGVRGSVEVDPPELEMLNPRLNMKKVGCVVCIYTHIYILYRHKNKHLVLGTCIPTTCIFIESHEVVR